MKLYFYQIDVSTRQAYIVGLTYNILYWSKGKLIDVRGLVTFKTASFIEIDIIEE